MLPSRSYFTQQTSRIDRLSPFAPTESLIIHTSGGHRIMRSTKTLSAAVIAMLALSSCGDSDQATDDAPEVESGDQEESNPAFGDPIEDFEFDGATSGPQELEIGEAAEIDQGPYENHGWHVATMTLEAVEQVDTCESVTDEAREPQNGHFVLVSLSIEATSHEDGFTFSPNDFYAENTESVNTDTQHATNGDTLACQEVLGTPDDIDPDETAERLIILDLPSPDSPITYIGGVHDVIWNPAGEAESDEEDPETVPEAGSDITFESCEEADAHWGGLMNIQLEGFGIDQDELDAVEEWMQENGCW